MSEERADIVIVGAGIIGSSVAYHLARAGVKRVIVLDRKDVCAGTSGACAGGLQIQTKTVGAKLAFARESLRLYDNLSAELDTDLEIVREGGIIVAFNEAEEQFLQDKSSELSAAGVDIRYVGPQEAREIEPGLAPGVIGALFCAEDRLVNPFYVNFGFANAAARLGVDFHIGVEVRGIVVQAGRVVGVKTDHGTISTELVVNAAGVWAPEIGKMVGLALPVVPRRGQLLVSEPMPPMVRGVVLAASYLLSKKMPPAGDTGGAKVAGGANFFQTASGNIIMGSTREFVGMDWNSTAAGIADIARQVISVIPATSQAHIIRTFAGLRPAAPDGMPILDRHPALEGFVVAGGHEGDGICLAPVTGHKLAGAITGAIGWDELAPFRMTRFPNIVSEANPEFAPF